MTVFANNNEVRELAGDEFDDRYTLLPNPLNPNAGWSYGDGPGCLFETYGPELEFVRRQDPRTVWTLVGGDNDGQDLISGDRLVNRIGYLVSTIPVTDGMEVRIHLHADEESPA